MFKIAASSIIINLLYYRTPANERGEVQYAALINQMNWRDAPVPPMQYQPIVDDSQWQGTNQSNKISVSRICYNVLLEDFFGKSS